jgi:hypothetical protein
MSEGSGDIDNDFGMKCPACGASDQIDVCADVWVRLCRDGTDVTSAANGDHEWSDYSGAKCCACGHGGNVADFQVAQQEPLTQAPSPQDLTSADVDRLLGLADQFLEDWETNQGIDDPECRQRRIEWDLVRPVLVRAPQLLKALEDAFALLDRISDTLHYEDGLPVTALEARDIEIIYGDSVTELARFETLLREARGRK